MEEDQSWLSSVIDRVDKLALSIVGYENDAPGQKASAFPLSRLLVDCLGSQEGHREVRAEISAPRLLTS